MELGDLVEISWDPYKRKFIINKLDQFGSYIECIDPLTGDAFYPKENDIKKVS